MFNIEERGMKSERECDSQSDVALPLIVQSTNDSKSDVGVRLKGGLKSLKFEKFKRFRVLQSLVFSLLSFSRTPTSKIHAFWNHHQVGGQLFNQTSPSHLSFNL